MSILVGIIIALVTLVIGIFIGMFTIKWYESKVRDFYLMLLEDMEDYGDMIEQKNPTLYKNGKNILDYATSLKSNQYGSFDSYHNIIMDNLDIIKRIHEEYALPEDNKDLVDEE